MQAQLAKFSTQGLPRNAKQASSLVLIPTCKFKDAGQQTERRTWFLSEAAGPR